MGNYAPGYFSYKYQVRQRSAVNTCVECEVKIIRKSIQRAIINRDKFQIIEGQQEIYLLYTGIPSNEGQKKRIRKVYKEEYLLYLRIFRMLNV